MKSKNIFIAILLVALLTRAYSLALTPFFMHPDSLFQAIEQAHIREFGYGIRHWEHFESVRPPLYQAIAVLALKGSAFLGMSHPANSVHLLKAASSAISVGVVCLTYLLARVLYSREAGYLAAYMALFSGMLWVWSSDTNSHIPAVFFILLSAYLYWGGYSKGNKTDYALSGFCLGVAFMFRFDSAVFLGSIAGFWALAKVRPAIKHYIMGFAAALAVQAALDWIYYGAFFASPINYLMTQVVEGRSSVFGIESPLIYVQLIVLNAPLLFALSYGFERDDRFRFLLCSIIPLGVFYAVIPHKELRFLLPLLPFAYVLLSQPLFKRFMEVQHLPNRTAAAVDKLTLALLLLSFALIGTIYTHYTLSHYLDSGGILGAFRFVGERDDSTGVAYDMPWYAGGGYTFLHKRIPMAYISGLDRLLDPRLDTSTCGRVNHTLIDFQCTKAEYALEDERINYFILHNNNAIEGNLRRVGDFGLVGVYVRGDDAV